MSQKEAEDISVHDADDSEQYSEEDQEQDEDEMDYEDDDNVYDDSDEYPIDDDDDEVYETDSIPLKEEEFVVLSYEDLVNEQMDSINKISELLAVNQAYARQLLMHYKWETQTILNKFDQYGSQRIFDEAGVRLTAADGSDSSDSLQTGVVECVSCYDDVEWKLTTALNCGHRFCNSCWTNYVSVRIQDGEFRRITCMQRDCPVVLDESRIPNFVDAKSLEKYKKSIIESYVEENKFVKWCPSVPPCGNAIRLLVHTPLIDIICKCKHAFCYNCLSEPHFPTPCAMVKKWHVQCRDDGETANWLIANTKDCPKCHKSIEKNGGCNLMTCKCGAYFCWKCGEETGSAHSWEEIYGHTCNRYKEKEEASEKAASTLRRYLHYYTRFNGHESSKKLEAKLMEKLFSIHGAYQRATTPGTSSSASKDSPIDVGLGPKDSDLSFLTAAIDRLVECRNILKWSYVFGYYLFDENPKSQFYQNISAKQRKINQDLFEDGQEQLEGLTERLSNLVEKFVNKLQPELRVEITNFTALTKIRASGIIEVQKTLLDVGTTI